MFNNNLISFNWIRKIAFIDVITSKIMFFLENSIVPTNEISSEFLNSANFHCARIHNSRIQFSSVLLNEQCDSAVVELPRRMNNRVETVFIAI